MWRHNWCRNYKREGEEWLKVLWQPNPSKTDELNLVCLLNSSYLYYSFYHFDTMHHYFPESLHIHLLAHKRIILFWRVHEVTICPPSWFTLHLYIHVTVLTHKWLRIQQIVYSARVVGNRIVKILVLLVLKLEVFEEVEEFFGKLEGKGLKFAKNIFPDLNGVGNLKGDHCYFYSTVHDYVCSLWIDQYIKLCSRRPISLANCSPHNCDPV